MVVNYQLGKIYKIVSDSTNKIYVGSTAEPTLARRITKHRANYKRYLNGLGNSITSFDIIKFGDAQIILIESYPCNSKDELHSRERHYIETLPNIVNKIIPTRTPTEYYEDNKDKIKDKIKKYYEDNKDKLKKYREDNKDKISEQFKCICGVIYTKQHKNRHEKTIKHQEYMKTI